MAIDRAKAINDLSKIKVKGDEEGLIAAFGVLIQQLPSNFWNKFSEKILKAAGDDMYEDAAGLLENAAAECGYHTGWGIINSEEFKAIVGPMIEKQPEDILHGAYAVLTAWGWAKSEIVELIPGEKMIVRTYDYYESDVKETFNPSKPFAFMVRGICRAFFDIGYGDKPYPDGLGKYKCEQTKAIELGDEYGEFVVTIA
jgi:hypothetical protein